MNLHEIIQNMMTLSALGEKYIYDLLNRTKTSINEDNWWCYRLLEKNIWNYVRLLSKQAYLLETRPPISVTCPYLLGRTQNMRYWQGLYLTNSFDTNWRKIKNDNGSEKSKIVHFWMMCLVLPSYKHLFFKYYLFSHQLVICCSLRPC